MQLVKSVLLLAVLKIMRMEKGVHLRAVKETQVLACGPPYLGAVKMKL
mgnify:CR=1 FL=1